MAKSTSFMQRIVQERGGDIRFIRAEEDGEFCWFYMKLHPEKLAEYEKALSKGEMNIRDYGKILESDWGRYPPMAVIRFMEEEYDFTTPAAEA